MEDSATPVQSSDSPVSTAAEDVDEKESGVEMAKPPPDEKACADRALPEDQEQALTEAAASLDTLNKNLAEIMYSDKFVPERIEVPTESLKPCSDPLEDGESCRTQTVVYHAFDRDPETRRLISQLSQLPCEPVSNLWYEALQLSLVPLAASLLPIGEAMVTGAPVGPSISNAAADLMTVAALYPGMAPISKVSRKLDDVGDLQYWVITPDALIVRRGTELIPQYALGQGPSETKVEGAVVYLGSMEKGIEHEGVKSVPGPLLPGTLVQFEHAKFAKTYVDRVLGDGEFEGAKKTMASRVFKANNLPGVADDEDIDEVKRRLAQLARASPEDAERARIAADLIAGHIDTALDGDGWDASDVRDKAVPKPKPQPKAGDKAREVEMTVMGPPPANAQGGGGNEDEAAKEWLGKQIEAADTKETQPVDVTPEWVKGQLEKLAEEEPENAKRYAGAIARLGGITDVSDDGLCVDYGVVYQPVDPMVLANRRFEDGVHHGGMWLAPQRRILVEKLTARAEALLGELEAEGDVKELNGRLFDSPEVKSQLGDLGVDNATVAASKVNEWRKTYLEAARAVGRAGTYDERVAAAQGAIAAVQYEGAVGASEETYTEKAKKGMSLGWDDKMLGKYIAVLPGVPSSLPVGPAEQGQRIGISQSPVVVDNAELGMLSSKDVLEWGAIADRCLSRRGSVSGDGGRLWGMLGKGGAATNVKLLELRPPNNSVDADTFVRGTLQFMFSDDNSKVRRSRSTWVGRLWQTVFAHVAASLLGEAVEAATPLDWDHVVDAAEGPDRKTLGLSPGDIRPPSSRPLTATLGRQLGKVLDVREGAALVAAKVDPSMLTGTGLELTMDNGLFDPISLWTEDSKCEVVGPDSNSKTADEHGRVRPINRRAVATQWINKACGFMVAANDQGGKGAAVFGCTAREGLTEGPSGAKTEPALVEVWCDDASREGTPGGIRALYGDQEYAAIKKSNGGDGFEAKLEGTIKKVEECIKEADGDGTRLAKGLSELWHGSKSCADCTFAIPLLVIAAVLSKARMSNAPDAGAQQPQLQDGKEEEEE